MKPGDERFARAQHEQAAHDLANAIHAHGRNWNHPAVIEAVARHAERGLLLVKAQNGNEQPGGGGALEDAR
jgi:hypothetical protein